MTSQRSRASEPGEKRDATRPPWAGHPPQAEAARARLLDAAARCIARDGLSATTIASVATEASVSRPTVYRYFDDRDELIRSTMRVAAERLRTLVRERMEARPSAADMMWDPLESTCRHASLSIL